MQFSTAHGTLVRGSAGGTDNFAIERTRFAGRKVASVNSLDGMKLLLDDGSWILIRESGTEPVARVYAESKTESDAVLLAKAARELLSP